MEATDVIEIIAILESAGIDVWLDGGWNIDALVEEQTRRHTDVDIVVRVADLGLLRGTLRKHGFRQTLGGTSSNFVLRDPHGREVDVHAVNFDACGNGIYRMENGEDWTYPAEGLTGRGKIADVKVRCLTPDVAMLCHTGYELDEKGMHDLRLLHTRFGVDYPDEHRDRFY